MDTLHYYHSEREARGKPKDANPGGARGGDVPSGVPGGLYSGGERP